MTSNKKHAGSSSPEKEMSNSLLTLALAHVLYHGTRNCSARVLLLETAKMH